jgi:signal transduction histidine kinase
MRRRLMTIGLVGITVLLATLAVPLAIVHARQQQSEQAIRELAVTQIAARELTVAVEAELPATIAQSLALRSGQDRSMLVLVRDGSVAAATGIAWDDLGVRDRELAELALRGRAGQSPIDDLLPVGDLVTAVPVSQGEETVGAVLSIADVDATRNRIVVRWALLAGLALGVLAAYVAIALPLTRWLIRPIDDLTAAALRDGSHPRPRVATTTGPPELRRLAHAFNEMSKSVERALERQRSFAADASHQLRNPLTSLRLRVENLEAHLDDDGSDPLAEAIGEVERMEHLVTQLLALASADDRHEPCAQVDVVSVVRERVDHWRAATGREIRVDRAVDGDHVDAFARDGALEHVLDVLIDNAVKFSPGAAPIEVRVGFDAGPDRATVSIDVIDHGRGMNEAECERACDRFWRAPASTGTPGSGLGLSIARRLVVQSGGDLLLRPTPGCGLDVTIRLPAVDQRTPVAGLPA